MTQHSHMYPPLPPVEVGEWLRVEDHGELIGFVQVERLTAKLIHAGGNEYSREHGAAHVGFGLYDAYEARVGKMQPGDDVELAAILADEDDE